MPDKILMQTAKPGILERVLKTAGFVKETSVNDILSYGRSTFIRDIFGEKLLTPHEEMQEVSKLYNSNGHVVAAVHTLKDFVLGAEQEVIADDQGTAIFLTDWLKNIGFFTHLSWLMENYIKCGNAYLEAARDSRGKIVKVQPIADPSRVYVQVNEHGVIQYYVQAVPNNTKIDGADFYDVYYWFNQPKQRIYGIRFEPNEIIHFKWGRADLPFYGRSPLASVVNDSKILKEIERDIAVIARYKAIPKKMISMPKANKTKLDAYGQYFSGLKDEENALIGEENVKIDDLSYAGKDLNLEWIVNYLKRKMTASAAPEYIIHGEDTNRATAKEQRIAYMMRVKSMRDQFAMTVETELLDHALSEYSTPSNKLNSVGRKFVCNDFEYDEPSEKKDQARSDFRDGIIKLNEAREILGHEPEKDEDLGEAYRWELEGSAPAPDEEVPSGGSGDDQQTPGDGGTPADEKAHVHTHTEGKKKDK